MTKYKVHTFLSSNNFTVSSISNNPVYDTIEYLVVAGGGPGTGSTTGGRSGGGGGAGGLILANVTLIDTNGLFVVVGGAGSNSTIFANSTPSFTAINAVRGGAGGTRAAGGTGGNGKPGGSGGGGSSQDIGDAAVLAGGLQWGQQGNEGGWAFSGPSGAGAGGGGGYSSRGSNSSGLVGGAGGFGANVNITGIFTVYSQGGNGGNATSSSPGINGSVNTGQGGSGGGGAAFTDDTLGGSGIVIIRYPVVPEIQPKISRVSNISSNLSTITTGDIVEFTITTVNAANGEVLYYSTNNQPNAAFTEGNTGSFEVNGNVGSVTLSIISSAIDGNYFDLQVRRTSPEGPILSQGGNVYSIIPIYFSITGGEVIDADGYRMHIFTQSNTFTISSLGSPNYLDYLIVGGGGGGSGGRPSLPEYYTGGGGGAGGVLTGNIQITPEMLTTHTANVGAGGVGGYNAAHMGGNSDILGLIAYGGGSGTGPLAAIGRSNVVVGGWGGSGGGSGSAGVSSGGMSVSGQGYPGGDNYSPPIGIGGGDASGGGGGAGQKGQGGQKLTGSPGQGFGGNGGNGLPISWVTPSYGTSGPTPGRWFGGGGSGFQNQAMPAPSIRDPGVLPVGGVGGGGLGATWTNTRTATAGTINTGGGGGAGWSDNTYRAKEGGSGIIIIRYPYQ